MDLVVKNIFILWRAFTRASEIKSSRGFTNVLSDRITQATTKSNMLAATERLGELLQVNLQYVSHQAITNFLNSVTKDTAENLLVWVRQFSDITAMILTQKTDEEFEECLNILKDVELLKRPLVPGKMAEMPNFDIEITARCLSPLSHGGDNKAGNATLFRRMQVLSDTGEIITLPFYSGNAVRGTIRDLLADHLLKTLGLFDEAEKRPLCKLWFFHTIYAGGCLEENSEQAKIFAKKLGASGATKGEGMAEFRKMLPSLSLLGTALGNRVIEGRVNVCDLRPLCVEWGGGDKQAGELFEWTFLTRREDNEAHADGENSSMIANSETLRVGTVLRGGIDFRGRMNKSELSCLLFGLELLKKKAVLGAESRRGFGKIDLTYKINSPEFNDLESTKEAYESYILSNKEVILTYLREIGALVGGDSDNGLSLDIPEISGKKSKKLKKDAEEAEE